MVFVFSTSHFVTFLFVFFAFFLFIGFSLFYVYLEASSLDVDYCLVFPYLTSNPEASNAESSLVLDYCTSKQATQTQHSWSVQSRGFESVVWLWT